MKRRACFLLLLSVLPLAVGALLYFLLRPEAYISKWIYSLLSFTPHFVGNTDAWWGCFLRNYAGDALWAFALTATVTCIVEKRYLSLFLSVGFEIFIELMQIIPAFRGTFDWFDILTELIASLCCAALIQIWKHKKEKENGKVFD